VTRDIGDRAVTRDRLSLSPLPEVQPIFEISVSNLQKIEKSGAKIVEKFAVRYL